MGENKIIIYLVAGKLSSLLRFLSPSERPAVSAPLLLYSSSLHPGCSCSLTEPITAVPKRHSRPWGFLALHLCTWRLSGSVSKIQILNVIGAARIRCFPLVQSPVARRVGLCGCSASPLGSRECGWSRNNFFRTSGKRRYGGKSRSGFQSFIIQPLADLCLC